MDDRKQMGIGTKMVVCLVGMLIVAIIHLIFIIAKIGPIFCAFIGLSAAATVAYTHYYGAIGMDITDVSLIVAGACTGVWILLHTEMIMTPPKIGFGINKDDKQ